MSGTAGAGAPTAKASSKKPRLFACQEKGCEYVATRSNNLTRHMLTHTGELPYVCDECDYAAKTSSDLTSHMRTHTGERPFGCDECDYRATTSGHLTKHMLRKHSKKSKVTSKKSKKAKVTSKTSKK